MNNLPHLLLAASFTIFTGCGDSTSTSATTVTTTSTSSTSSTTETGNALMDGQVLVEADCTSSCHAGQDMGELSARFPNDDDLADIIWGVGGGAMSGNTAADNWSENDMDNAISYMRSLE